MSIELNELIELICRKINGLFIKYLNERGRSGSKFVKAFYKFLGSSYKFKNWDLMRICYANDKTIVLYRSPLLNSNGDCIMDDFNILKRKKKLKSITITGERLYSMREETEARSLLRRSCYSRFEFDVSHLSFFKFKGFDVDVCDTAFLYLILRRKMMLSDLLIKEIFSFCGKKPAKIRTFRRGVNLTFLYLVFRAKFPEHPFRTKSMAVLFNSMI